MGVSESPPSPIVGDRRDSGVIEGGRRCSCTEANLQKQCQTYALNKSHINLSDAFKPCFKEEIFKWMLRMPLHITTHTIQLIPKVLSNYSGWQKVQEPEVYSLNFSGFMRIQYGMEKNISME
jgi:hypothetical protein